MCVRQLASRRSETLLLHVVEYNGKSVHMFSFLVATVKLVT